MGNPILGASWEGLVIENIIVNTPDWTPYFYRTATGDEIDLVLIRGNQKIAIECKASSAPQLTKGGWNALNDIHPDKAFVIAPISGNSYMLNDQVTVASLTDGIDLLKMD